MGTPRVLITGGTGLLGKALVETAPHDWEVLATYHRTAPPVEWGSRFRHLDVRDEPAVVRLVSSWQPDCVIHTASIGSVEEAERAPEPVRAVNVGGTAAVGRACRQLGAQLIFISSNAVFDGEHPPYAEADPVRAINRYGALKIEAEEALRAGGLPHTVIRPILLYGWPLPGGRDNVVTRWLASLERGVPVEVAADVTSMPVPAATCAEAVWAAARLKRFGIYHVAGADRLSLVAFAQETAQVFGCDERLIRPVDRSWFSELAPRPRDTSFITTKMERELGIRPPGIREGLLAMQRSRLPAV
jgi:dTDP-4-dehydrorhamnose reductase